MVFCIINGKIIQLLQMNKNTFIIGLTAALIGYLIGAWMIPLMDIDASQYASISRSMLASKSYLQVFDLGKDYLDKPPMLFWLSALSMKIFGVHDWAYRLPSLLFLCIALYATFKFTSLYYNTQIARLATLILASCQAFFLMAHDVRTDTMLVGWVMFSIYCIGAWSEGNGKKYFYFALFAIAGGMMTKGPIALVVPVLAFAPYWIVAKKWNYFFKAEYLLGVLILAILLIPMSWGLYQQYDLHPGKIINGKPIDSGLKFYYWTQSFGRYTGENAYKEMGYFSFLLENMFWSFLPWIFVFLWALIAKTFLIFKEGFFKPSAERISFFGFVFTYIVLSRSQAQLPHYIFVVFPFAAIITAVHWDKFIWYQVSVSKPIFYFYRFHLFIGIILIALTIIILLIPFGIAAKSLLVFAIFLLLLIIAILQSNSLVGQKWFQLSFVTMLTVNLVLNLHFYPHLLQYQWGNQLAKQMEINHWNKQKMVLFKIPNSNALHFYGEQVFPIKEDSLQLKEGDWVITDRSNEASIRQIFPKSEVQYHANRFHVTMLSLPFLNPNTREKETTPYVLILLKK